MSGPFHSHATYSLYEIIAAHGVAGNGSLRETREGVMWVESHKSDLFFITLNKSDQDYSPTTRYQDYPISPTLFHWESQSRTATESPTGQRYVHHPALEDRESSCLSARTGVTSAMSARRTCALGRHDT